MRALRDMNLPKFVFEDVPLFLGLISDLFPGLELPVSEYGTLQGAIQTELSKLNLQQHEFLISKIFDPSLHVSLEFLNFLLSIHLSFWLSFSWLFGRLI